ncbi:hypothetical protein KA005_65580, partial [bacterium]|nr:hypothetical protein [bacterium]
FTISSRLTQYDGNFQNNNRLNEMKPDPIHEKNLAVVLELEPREIQRRLKITDYNDPDYIACEVLASLVRCRFGKNNGVLGFIVNVLYARLTKFVNQYIHKNKQWYNVVNSSNEILGETVSYAWEKLCTDKNSVTLADVRFRKWVKDRAIDYFISQTREKNIIFTTLRTQKTDEEGNEIALDDFLEHDPEDGQEKVLERAELSIELILVMMTWERHIRLAVIYRLQKVYNWKQVSELLEVSIPTARKYYEIGVERLREVENDYNE